MVTIVDAEFRALSNSLVFSYTTSTAMRLSPNAGSLNGGTVVTYTSEQGILTGPLWCEFHDPRGVVSVVIATIQSTMAATCKSPAVSFPMRTMACLRVYGACDTQFSFDYFEPAQVIHLSPTHGPAVGGSAVILMGNRFTEQTASACAFGNAISPARLLSDSRLECISPQAEENAFLVAVDVIDRNGESAGKSMAFTYVPEGKPQNIHPSNGPTWGGTTVVITFNGILFDNRGTQAIECAFGMQHVVRVPASIWSAQTIACTAPPAPAGMARVFISGQASRSMGLYPILFEYVETSVASASPLLGPTHGRTRVVVSGFRIGAFPNASLVCRFGQKTSSVIAVSLSRLVCLAPRASISRAVNLQIEVGKSSPRIVAHFWYHYYAPQTFDSIAPLFASSQGGATVTIHSGVLQPIIPLPVRKIYKIRACQEPRYRGSSRFRAVLVANSVLC